MSLPLFHNQRLQPLRCPRLTSGFARASIVGFGLALVLATITPPTPVLAQSTQEGQAPIRLRNIDVTRSRATERPRNEDDQALVGGWPLYRTEKGQQAFNDSMATLAATDGPPPAAAVFAGCEQLDCKLSLPKIDEDGWIPPGRIWLSPSQYVLIVQSPRLPEGKPYRRRNFSSMRIFVYHEFQNSTLNTDIYDTVSSHAFSVFVPLYMSKPRKDAHGTGFVTIVQVAPYDVVSIHASNMGSAGPGMEVAKNSADPLDPLQASAGILIGTIIKAAAPHLKVVNHRGSEGRPMLKAYEQRLERLSGRSDAPVLALPFVPAPPERVAVALGGLGDLVLRPGASPRVASLGTASLQVASEMPVLVVPLTRVTRSIGPPEPEDEFTLIGPIERVRRPAVALDNLSGG